MASTPIVINSRVISIYDGLNIRSGAGTNYKIIKKVKKGDFIGFAKYVRSLKGTDGKVLPYRWIGISDDPSSPSSLSSVQGWVIESSVKFMAPLNEVPVNGRDGIALINNLVSNDQKLYYELLISADNIKKLKAKGVDTSEFEKRLAKLVSEYTARQYKLKNSKLLKVESALDLLYKNFVNIKIDVPPGYYAALGFEIGALQIIPIAIGIVVGVATAVLIYETFKPDYETGKVNLKESKELSDLLAKTDPTTRKKIEADLNKQIDDAYNQGKTDEKFGNIGSFAKYGALALAAYFIIKAVEKNK